MWLDEAYSLGVADQFAKGVSATGGTMVLYYSFLAPWVRVSQSVAWVRALSLVFAVLTMPMAALLGRRIAGRRMAVIAPALLCVNWMFGYMAAEARAYSLETLLAITGWYALVRIVDAGTSWRVARRWWVLLAVLAAVGVFAHGLFPLFVGAWVVAIVLSPNPRRAVLPMLPVIGLCLVALAALYTMGIGDVGDWVESTQWWYIKRSYHTFSSPYGWVSRFVVLLVAVSLVLAAWRFLGARRRGDEARMGAWKQVVPAVWLLVPTIGLLAVSLVRNEFQSRYLAPITPSIAFSMAFVLLWGDDALRRWRGGGKGVLAKRSWLPLAMSTLLVVAAIGIANFHSLASYRNADWDRIAGLVDEHVQPGDGIVFFSDLTREPFEAAWQQSAHAVAPVPANMPRPLGKVVRIERYDWPDYAHRRNLLKYQRVWMIKIGTTELGADIYADRPPITTNFKLVGLWNYKNGPVVVALFERTSTVDPYPDAK